MSGAWSIPQLSATRGKGSEGVLDDFLFVPMFTYSVSFIGEALFEKGNLTFKKHYKREVTDLKDERTRQATT